MTTGSFEFTSCTTTKAKRLIRTRGSEKAAAVNYTTQNYRLQQDATCQQAASPSAHDMTYVRHININGYHLSASKKILCCAYVC